MNTNIPFTPTFTAWLREEPEWCRAAIRSSAQHSARLLVMMSLTADDIVSDVIICMQKNTRSFASRNDLSRYLARCTTNWICSLARKHELRTRRGLHDFEPPELDTLPSSSPAADLCMRDECAIVTNWMKQQEDGARLLEALEAVISTDENPTTSAIGRAMGCSRREVEKIVRDVRSRARMRFLQ